MIQAPLRQPSVVVKTFPPQGPGQHQVGMNWKCSEATMWQKSGVTTHWMICWKFNHDDRPRSTSYLVFDGWEGSYTNIQILDVFRLRQIF